MPDLATQPETMTNPIRARLISGVLWSGSGRAIALTIHFLVVLAMARFLSPDDFGVVGLSMVVVNVLFGVSDVGLGAALIQKEKIAQQDLDTVFWVNLLLSCLLASGLAMLSHPVAAFLGNRSMAPVVTALSLVLPLAGAAVVPNALLSRDMKFATIARRDVGGELVYGAIGIGCSLAGFGVWSLVAAVLGQRCARSILAWVGIAWFPGMRIDRHSMRDLFNFGGFHLLATIGQQVLSNADSFFVGRFLGIRALGHYTLAFQLAAIPIQRLATLLRNVAFPGFSKLQHDMTRLRSGYLTLLNWTALIALPFSLFVILLAPVIVSFYGSDWSPAVLPMQLLAMSALFYGIEVADVILLATGKPRLRLRIVLVRSVSFFLLTFGIGLRYGTVGVCACMLAAVSIGAVLTLRCVNVVTGVRTRQIAQAIVPTLLCVVTGWLVAYVTSLVLPDSSDVSTIVAGTMGLAAYAMLVSPRIIQLLQQITRGRRQPLGQVEK